MIKLQFFGFILRWLASSIGMFFCITWFGKVDESSIQVEQGWMLYALAGFIFALLNSILKPIIKIFALPLAVLTLGLSTIIINTLIVIITIHFLPGVEMEIWAAALSSVIMSIINAVLNFLIK